MASACSEVLWLVRLLLDMQVVVPQPISLFCDNMAALYITRNPVFHERTKHFEIDCHFLQHHVTDGLLDPRHIGTSQQPAELLTKPYPADQRASLLDKLGISNILHAPA
ncbi:unnamed protein product [Rhodiola kirilowii]